MIKLIYTNELNSVRNKVVNRVEDAYGRMTKEINKYIIQCTMRLNLF